MSIKAIRYLLANNAGLTAVVSADKIMVGPLPQNTALPAIAIEHVSTVRRNQVAATAVQFCTSRVQVSVMAASYVLLQSTLALVRAALPRSRGTVNGVQVDSVLSESEGPHFADEESGIFLGSMDFIVTFNE